MSCLKKFHFWHHLLPEELRVIHCVSKNLQMKKRIISKRNLNSIRIANKKMISATKTKYFLPYAGFFTESANRDKFIKKE